jgi:4a-hydroxytetrahydrobiopterin dehydratase
MSKARELTSRRCKPCASGTPALTNAEADSLMRQLEGWQRYDHLINKTYRFKNYYQTIAFVNAVAWLSHAEDHHPELTVGYNSCLVEYTTHSVHGLSENDFICAAKVDALFKI